MGTAIKWAPQISLLVIIVTMIYMYYRHKLHHKNQSIRMYDFNRVMTKTTGIPIIDPLLMLEETKKKYETQLDEAEIGYEAEIVTLYCGESQLIPIKHFVWIKQGTVHLYPTKEVLKNSTYLEMDLIKIRRINISSILHCKVVKTDDIIEELQQKTILTYENQQENATLSFKVDDLVVFKLLIPGQVEENSGQL